MLLGCKEKYIEKIDWAKNNNDNQKLTPSSPKNILRY